MKIWKSVTTIIPALCMVVFITACKKDKDDKPVCRIITITPSSGDPFNFTYDNDGKLSTISTGSNVTTFVYSGNSAIATTLNSGVFDSKTIITNNAQGMATNVRTEQNASGTDWNNAAYDYNNGTELIKATNTSSGGGSSSVSTVTWTNNNLGTITSGSSTTTLDYYNDKPAQTGDYLFIAQLVQGYQIYRTKSLLKSIFDGSNITSFNYNFGSDGYISSLTATQGATVTTYTYQYQCN